MKQSEILERELKKLEEREVMVEKEDNTTTAAMYDAVEHLEEEIKKIKSPFNKKLEALRDEKEQIRKDKWDLRTRIETEKSREVMEDATKEGAMNEEAVKAFVKLIRFENWAYVTKKKTLKNGLDVFRVTDSKDNETNEYIAYFYFRGVDCVAVWVKRKAKHRGDDTSSRCWVDVLTLRNENEASNIEKEKFKRPTTYMGYNYDATLKQFNEHVETFVPNDMCTLDLEDYDSKHELRSAKDW